MVDSLVARTFGMDFIYFDLIFLTFWIGMMIKKKYWMPIKWGLLGWVVYIFTDYILWYLWTGTRHYTGPLDPFVFFMWFCFSPGMVQFSYVIIMFEKRNFKETIFWTLFFYIGWLSVSIGSQLIPLDNSIIEVYRDMNNQNQRLNEAIMVGVNILVALILYWKKKIRVEDIIYLFIVGTLVEFALELTLSASGIRLTQGTWSFELMLVNTLLEFNLGIILMYLLWFPFKRMRFGKYYAPISRKDFKNIQTDFNCVIAIGSNAQIKPSMLRDYLQLYSKESILADLNYFSNQYLAAPLAKEIQSKIEEQWAIAHK